MADKKIVFIAFAIEDKTLRDFLVGQARNTKTPFEFIDMGVKEPYDTDWKSRVRTRIRRSDGVIALISKSTVASSGEKWEINCAIEEEKPLLGIWGYKNDRTSPVEMSGQRIVEWSWDAIEGFINKL
jgi:hypothetical protein